MKITTYLLGLMMAVGVLSCNDDVSYQELADAEVALLREYVSEAQIPDSAYLSTEIYYLPRKEGPGRLAVPGDLVSVRYEVFLLDSTLIGTNEFSLLPYEFTLNSLSSSFPGDIVGIHYGALLMKEGGKATLIVPSAQAYGSNIYNSIGAPRYTPFRIELEITNLTAYSRD